MKHLGKRAEGGVEIDGIIVKFKNIEKELVLREMREFGRRARDEEMGGHKEDVFYT